MRRGANGGLIAIAGYDASERHAVLRGVQCHQDLHSDQAFRLGWIDPCGAGQFGWLRGEAFEAGRIDGERGVEGDGAPLGESNGRSHLTLARGGAGSPEDACPDVRPCAHVSDDLLCPRRSPSKSVILLFQYSTYFV